MPLWKNTQHAFIAGQLDANVMGRQDMDRYFKGATLLKNFLVKRQGCISKRRGTDLTADLDGLLGTTYDGTPITPGKMRLVPVTNGDDGRYVILSGGVGFVASREGVMTADNRHVRKLDSYVALDEAGRPVISGGSDSRASSKTPVDVVHTVSAGNYSVSRHATLADAISAASAGDTLRLHGNMLLEPNRNGQGATVDTPVVVSKSLTIDLYGYEIVQYTRKAYLCVNAPDVDLTVTSTRPGARFTTMSDGNAYWIYFKPYESGSSRSGTLTLSGDISWKMAGGAANYGVTAKYAAHVVIESGTFDYADVYQGRLFQFDHVGDVTVNGGTFKIGNAASDTITAAQGTTGGDSKTAFYRPSCGTITINGGTFENTNTNGTTESVFIDGNASGSVLILGGRFSAPSESHYFRAGAWSDASSNFTSASRIAIFRGEFAHGQIKDVSAGTNQGIDHFGNYGGNTTSTTATEITFTEAGVTATSGAWTLSEGSSGLTFWWNGTSAKWQVYGTPAGGSYFSEMVAGTPADTVVSFPESGIVATRSWSFSDGRDWTIRYKSSKWYITATVPNDVQPNDDGFYGVKLRGEGDYRWDGLQHTDVPYRFAIPYIDDDLADLCIRQSGDTLFVAHRDYPPAKIYFDKFGNAYFEELTLDNTDYNPPVIESAVMDGQDPKETDWPSGFDSGLKTYAKSKGTVTSAGVNSNSSSGDDGSSQSATTWEATAESKDRTTGKKTVTVVVKSSTTSVAIEITRTYNNGIVTGETRTPITTTGTAMNEASATSVIVTRTVRYVATYIKDGKESRPSAPVAVDYDMPWANNAVVNLVVSKGTNEDEPDYYNIYKDNGNGYGLIGTIGVEATVSNHIASVDEYTAYIPDNSASQISVPVLMDYLEGKGLDCGSTMRKICSAANVKFTASPASDACLICPPSRKAEGLTFTFRGDARFKRVRIYLDGRIYDKENDTSYLAISAPEIKLYATYRNTSGESCQMQLRDDGQSSSDNMWKHAAVPTSYVSGTGYLGSVAQGIYGDWLMLPRKAVTLPNGDTVYVHTLGQGDQSEYLNKHPRYLDFDVSWGQSHATNFASMESITLKFDGIEYFDWSGNRNTGIVRAMRFYATSDQGLTGGNFQDDYINPDMTVTPPDDTQDAHFSAADEYPGCVGIYEQRLVFASTRSSPSTIWMSRIADLYNFTVHDSIREDDALELTLAATEFPNINHLVMGRDLMLFGDGGEWLISPVQGNALTYKTASAKLQSMIGSDRALQPLQLADETLFAERGGTCLRTINYNYASDSYQSQDLSVIAQNLFRANPIVSMAYKQHPDSIVECVLADGRVATLVYMKEQEVAAWSIQELGGGWKAREIVSPKCIVNGTTEMMLLVEKSGAFQLWKVRDDDDAMTDASQVILDGMHIETDSAPTGTGEHGVALGDGTYAIGWPVEAEFVSIRPEPEKGQTAQMEIKNSTETEIRVTDATTFSVKPFDASSGWRDVNLPVVRSGANVTLSAKDCKRLMTGTNSRDGRLHLKHTEPWPLTILSISTTYQVEYENGTGEGGQ